MAVGLGVESPYYLELEALTGDGAPRVRITVYNVAGTELVRLQRTCEGETQIVQGARSASITEVGVIVDWAVPLGREVTYTVVVDGEARFSAGITVHSDVAWIQDPLRPDGAIPVESKQLKPGSLLLDSKAINQAKYANNGTAVQVMGSRYPRYYGGQRSAASDVSITMWSDDEPTETALRQMIGEAPVILFRPLPRHRLLPPVVYMAADADEDQITVRLGADLTHWTLSGNLVQAVFQAARSGYITYGQVQDLLGGYTYGEVQAAAASTVYLDWQKNPLIFANL